MLRHEEDVVHTFGDIFSRKDRGDRENLQGVQKGLMEYYNLSDNLTFDRMEPRIGWD